MSNIVKEKNGWRLLRDNLEQKIWKRPRYYYEVQYEENGKFVKSMGTFSLREAMNHFNFQKGAEIDDGKLSIRIEQGLSENAKENLLLALSNQASIKGVIKLECNSWSIYVNKKDAKQARVIARKLAEYWDTNKESKYVLGEGE